MIADVLLAVHVVSGTAGLLLGPVAMAARKRQGWHTGLGIGYQGAVVGTTGSAVGLVALAPVSLWPLALIAVATQAAALAGWQARRRCRRGWEPLHIRLMCGSYLSLVTAALVVNWSSPVAWVLPTLVGAPLIAVAVKRAARRTTTGPAAAPAR